MNTALYTSLVSMSAVQQKLDVLSRNVANVNTTGYKRQDASFEDLLTSMVKQQKELQLSGRATVPGLVLGNGARVHEMKMYHRQGNMIQTDNPLDLAIIGDGFFELELVDDPVEDAQGNEVPRAAYTRDGTFKLSRNPNNPAQSFISTQTGRYLRGINNQPIQVPTDSKIIIDEKGVISAVLPNGDRINKFAQLKVVRIMRPQLMDNVGDNMYTLPKTTGVNNPDYVNLVDYDNPVEAAVTIEQGYLESSNVNLSEEMTELLTTQRSFQLLARSLTTTDTMMGLVNNLRA